MTTWEPGTFIMHGLVYEYEGKTYRARYVHTALPEYPPDKTPEAPDRTGHGALIMPERRAKHGYYAS